MNQPSQFQVPQVTPPQGQRTPLGGAPAGALPTNAAPAPLGGAPVPPAQPSWAQPAAGSAGAGAAPIVIGDATATDQIADGLRHGAALSEIQRYFPAVTAELARALAAERGIDYPAAEPAAASPAAPAAPSSAAPAAAAAPASVPAMPESEKRSRISKKKDEPKIKVLFTEEGRSAEEISNIIGLQQSSVERAIERLGLTRGTPSAQAEGAAPAPSAPAASDAPDLPKGPAEDVRFASAAVTHVQHFALGSGLTFGQIAAAARLLEAVEPA